MKRILVVIAITSVLLTGQPASAQVGDPYINKLWSGWVAESAGVDKITKEFAGADTQWTQPSVTCRPGENSQAYIWVGLGGYYTANVEPLAQAGTAVECLSGKPTYFAWYEVQEGDNPIIPICIADPCPKNPRRQDLLPIPPGTVVHAWVNKSGPSRNADGSAPQANLQMRFQLPSGDLISWGKQVSPTKFVSFVGHTAECIVERPPPQTNSKGVLQLGLPLPSGMTPIHFDRCIGFGGDPVYNTMEPYWVNYGNYGGDPFYVPSPLMPSTAVVSHALTIRKAYGGPGATPQNDDFAGPGRFGFTVALA